MTSPSSTGTFPEPMIDEALRAAVGLARSAAETESGVGQVGDHLGVQEEDGALTHLFEATMSGYRGWRWAVTVASGGVETPVTVSEVVLLPGEDALTGPSWVPWQNRIRPGDLGVGDLMPPEEEDDRLVPGYLASDDPQVEEVAKDLGLGRVRVMSREGRLDAAHRWHRGSFGPRSDMARSAPATCGTCGFYLPVAGSLRAAFGVCGNEISPADGHAVHAEYGCGAHSEAEVDTTSTVPVTEMVYDDTNFDVEPKEPREPAEPTEPTEPAQTEEPGVVGEVGEVGEVGDVMETGETTGDAPEQP